MREVSGGGSPALGCTFPTATHRPQIECGRALYGAFAVIAALVFGTLSYHPF